MPEPTTVTDADRAKAAEVLDAKYRRCEEHNRARYWCGCYYADAARAEADQLRDAMRALAEELEMAAELYDAAALDGRIAGDIMTEGGHLIQASDARRFAARVRDLADGGRR